MKHIHVYKFKCIHIDNVAKMDYYIYECIYCGKTTHFKVKRKKKVPALPKEKSKSFKYLIK